MNNDTTLDFSVLDELLGLDLSDYPTLAPGFLEDYGRRLIAAQFSQQFCEEECRRICRWYDIVRLARQTRITYSSHRDHCLANGLPVPPEPDTVHMLLLARLLDPLGVPEHFLDLLRRAIKLLVKCRERYQEETEDDPANIVFEPFEEALARFVPIFRHRRRLMAETRECHTGEQLVLRVFGLAMEKGWLTWKQCRRKAVREAFFPFLPSDAKSISKGNLNHHMDDKLARFKPKK